MESIIAVIFSFALFGSAKESWIISFWLDWIMGVCFELIFGRHVAFAKNLGCLCLNQFWMGYEGVRSALYSFILCNFWSLDVPLLDSFLNLWFLP